MRTILVWATVVGCGVTSSLFAGSPAYDAKQDLRRLAQRALAGDQMDVEAIKILRDAGPAGLNALLDEYPVEIQRARESNEPPSAAGSMRSQHTLAGKAPFPVMDAGALLRGLQ